MADNKDKGLGKCLVEFPFNHISFFTSLEDHNQTNPLNGSQISPNTAKMLNLAPKTIPNIAKCRIKAKQPQFS